MTAKEIHFRGDAPGAVPCSTVCRTLAERREGHPRPEGPQRRAQKSFGSPVITKDGVTVAKEIELADKFQNMGAQMVKEVASKTSDVAGDGTTTATVLAEAIFNQPAPSWWPPVPTRWSSSSASTPPSRRDRRRAQGASPARSTTGEEIAKVGTISANGDAEIGAILSECMDKVGKEGVITVEEAKGLQTESRHRRGHAVRPRLPLPVLRHRHRPHGGRARQPATSSSTRRRSRR